MTQRYAHLIPGRLHQTSQIMENFWQDFGATKSASQVCDHVGKGAPNPHQQRILGQASW
jgi:hypothetical protein